MDILIADDDIKSAEFVRRSLVAEGYSCEVVHNGTDAVQFCMDQICDLLILDRMMPDMDGLAVIKTVRAAGKHFPVLFLTALGSLHHRVEGLDAGGDDYLAKPVHRQELIARVKALKRRTTVTEVSTILKVHNLELNLLSREARRSGTVISLKTKEFELLKYLMCNSEHVVTKTMLLKNVWGFSFDPQTSVVETHISRLRLKIDRPFPEPLIETIKNAGYSIRAPRGGIKKESISTLHEAASNS